MSIDNNIKCDFCGEYQTIFDMASLNEENVEEELKGKRICLDCFYKHSEKDLTISKLRI